MAPSSARSLAQAFTQAPVPFDAAAGARALAALRETVAIPAEAEALLAGAFGSAPYLARLARRFPQDLERMLSRAPEQSLQSELDAILDAANAPSQEAMDAALRRAKGRVHLLTALADLGGVWDLGGVTAALSDAADASLAAALAGHARLMGEGDSAPAGVFVVALGKQGGRELNYSSDIDIAAFYDPGVMGRADAGEFAVRLIRRVVATLSRQTADGYVFRTDLRLRPDPLSTPVAMSVDAATRYYESAAQTWERAAWIKARIAAGDGEAGQDFLESFQPFVWRRSMDYAAIGDMAAIMRQIADEGAAMAPGAAGLDIKRCAGGIRHIEFFAQIQQLLWGGRDPALRVRDTQSALAGLAEAGLADYRDCALLSSVYARLRAVEHRIQMLEDQPTQTLPDDSAARTRVACLSGRRDLAAFDAEIVDITARAAEICGRLLADAPVAESPLGIEGLEPSQAALARLSELNFDDAASAWAVFQAWNAGQPRALRSERARALLRRLAPRIAQEIGATAAPAQTLARFDEFVRALPAGVQILSMLEREPRLLSELVDMLSLSPRLAHELAGRPDALEAFLAFDPEELSPEALEARIGGEIGAARDLEQALDRARRLTRETMFLIAMAVLRGEEEAQRASEYYASLAGALIRALLPAVEADFRRRYGAIEGEFAVLGFGSFGASEMTVRSDTDIVMVYDAPEAAQSDGERPLPAETYFGRLAQRFVSALSAPTAEGLLFHIDLNLRPFGGSGPVASRFAAYDRYYRTEAWTWEKMALTRAHFVAGSAALGARLESLVRSILTEPRDAAATAHDVADMRERLMREKPPAGFWDLVQSPGALTDVRFTVQYLQLVAAAHTPGVLRRTTQDGIAALAAAGALTEAQAAALTESNTMHLDLAQLFALAAEGPFDPETAAPRLQARIARACGVATLASLASLLGSVRAAARAVYETKVAAASS